MFNIIVSVFYDKLSRYASWWLMVAGMVLAAVAYLQVLNAPFISDDLIYITGNTKLGELQVGELWRLLLEPYNSVEFLPLRDFSYWLDIKFFGLNPAAFRLHNLLLYLCCCALVYLTTASLWRTFRPAEDAKTQWVAATVTALFALHPAHVEAVVWISGRKDLLSGMFSLLALWLSLKTKQPQGLAPAYALLTLVAFSAAVFSKGISVAVAPIIALLWMLFWLDVPATSRRVYPLLWPLSILLLAGALAILFASHSTIRESAYWGVETLSRALAALGWLTRLALGPEDRHYFYPVFEDKLFSLMLTLGAVVALAAGVGLAILFKKRSLSGWAVIAFLLLCLPYTQLLPYKTFSLVSDRFLFLAVWLAILLLVALAWRLKPLPRAVLLLVIALPWIQQTIVRPVAWRSVGALAEADLTAYPGDYIPALYKINQVQLPQGLYREARETAGKINDPGMKLMANALIQSDFEVYAYAWSTGKTATAIASLWNLDRIRKQTPAGIKWNPSLAFIWDSLRIRLDIRWKYLAGKFPADAAVRYNAGVWLLGEGKYQEAITQLDAAVELSPADAGAYCSLAEVFQRTGQMDQALLAQAKCHNPVSRSSS
jgi:tetratricopeptide (TPR) repeat protein